MIKPSVETPKRAIDDTPANEIPIQRRNPLKTVFESVLWESRLLMIIAVVLSALMTLGVFFLTAIDVVQIVQSLAAYADFSLAAEARDDLRAKIITLVVKTIDTFLIAAILLIFAFGLYELFINELNMARKSEAARKLLQTHTLDELKSRVAGLLLLILVIEFFQQALRFRYNSALDIFYLAAGILLISAAFYLSNLRTGKDANGESESNKGEHNESKHN